MYELMIVDDERIIREGISVMVNWEQHGVRLAGTAQNGVEALEMIMNKPPHIVITDIKMPVLSGLELVARVKKIYPDVLFIILSGYGEFELANRAMQHGVRHYLLKPCSEEKITAVLVEVLDELQQREKKEEVVKQYKQSLEKVIPLIKEQFIRDFIMNRSYTRNELEYYCKLLKMEGERVRMVLFQPEGEYSSRELFALTSIINELVEERQVCFDTIVKNQVLALIKACGDEQLTEMITRVKVGFCYYNDVDITIAYSEEGSIEEIPALYMQVQEYIQYSFYSGKGSIISKRDMVLYENKKNSLDMTFDLESIVIAIKSGNLNLLETGLDRFFDLLQSMEYSFNKEKTYCMELFMSVVRQCRNEEIEKYLGRVMDLQRMEKLIEVKDFIRNIASTLAETNHEAIVNRHSKLISSIMKHVQENISNSRLSLKWLANEVLYMNVGYLSKLFIKETGEKFSSYVLKLRMEKAKELISKSDDDRIYEVALKIGLGDNPQYFSQIFKKYTGLCPSDYKKKPG